MPEYEVIQIGQDHHVVAWLPEGGPVRIARCETPDWAHAIVMALTACLPTPEQAAELEMVHIADARHNGTGCDPTTSPFTCPSCIG